MLRRPKKPDELIVGTRPGGLVFSGRPSAIERFADGLTGLAAKSGEIAAVANAVKEVADQMSKVGDGAAKFVELAPRSVALLREHGAIATDDGFFRSIVHDGKAIAGNVDWKPVTTPTDLTQLQSAAVGLALQASIKNLADAVARIEIKVDVVADLIRAEQFGDVLGQHRVLQRLLDMTDEGGVLSSTDWHTIDQMRVDITSSLERTRMFIRTRIAAVESGWLTRKRADAAEQLLESGLVDTLGLLAVCEQNLAGWHQLRLLRVEATEPDRLDAVIGDIEGDLSVHRADDTLLAQELVDLLDGFVAATGFEGFEPWKRKSLHASAEQLRSATQRFITERRLDVDIDGHGQLPSTVDSIRYTRDKALEGSRRAIETSRRAARAARRRVSRSDADGDSDADADADGDGVPELDG